MRRTEIIELLKKYKFDTKNYIVISGAAMVIANVKDQTNDIDIAVSKEYYNYLLNNYNCEFDCVNIYNNKVFFIDNIINFSYDYFDCKYTVIDGIKVQTLYSIKQLKKNLNREKDIEDIKLIDEKIKYRKL